MEQKLKIRNFTSMTVLNLTQIQNLYLSENFLIDNPNVKNFRLLIFQKTKENVIKNIF